MSRNIARLALPAVFALALLASAAWSQDQAEEAAPAEESGEAAAGEAPEEEDAPEQPEAEDEGSGPVVGLDEIPELDQQTYEQDDDEFIPTEEIPVDQSIPFPTDI